MLARDPDLAWRLFRIEYTLAGMGVLLYRIGWSVKVPARRAAERDEAAIARWKEEGSQYVIGRNTRRPVCRSTSARAAS